jgi:hypothetical protein
MQCLRVGKYFYGLSSNEIIDKIKRNRTILSIHRKHKEDYKLHVILTMIRLKKHSSHKYMPCFVCYGIKKRTNWYKHSLKCKPPSHTNPTSPWRCECGLIGATHVGSHKYPCPLSNTLIACPNITDFNFTIKDPIYRSYTSGDRLAIALYPVDRPYIDVNFIGCKFIGPIRELNKHIETCQATCIRCGDKCDMGMHGWYCPNKHLQMGACQYRESGCSFTYKLYDFTIYDSLDPLINPAIHLAHHEGIP